MPTVEAPILTYPRMTLLAAGVVLAVNDVVLAAGGHVFAASCVDAVVLVLLLNAAVVYEHRSGGRDLAISRAFGALALVAAVPVAAAALPLRHVSEATGTIIIALPVSAACLYFASRHAIKLRLFSRSNASVQVAAVVAAIAFGFCAYILGGPTVSVHGVGPALLALIALTLAAVAEELLFRGVVQASLAQIFGAVGVVFATLLSVALFTTVSWWLIAVLSASLSFALVVAVTGVLAPAIIAHVAFALSATVVWPSLLEHWRLERPISVLLGAILCGGFLVAMVAVVLTEERRRV